MSSQVTPIIGGGLPNAQIYRLISPAVIADASGGQVQVNANSKFATNLPIDRYALITRILYFLTWTKLPVSETDNTSGGWNVFVQISEALARTVPSTTDPVYVDEWTFFVRKALSTSGAFLATYPGTIDRPLFNPWASVAQNLNLIVAVQPNNVGANGPNVSVACSIEYQLLSLMQDIRTYLATRLQIAGQA